MSAATAGTVLSVFSVSALAAHEDSLPEGAYIEHDPDYLAEYQPRFLMNEEDVEVFEALRAWAVKSNDYATDALVYWMEYSEQEGVTQYDSHPGDHEPVYVFVDSERGIIREVVYSAYHWLAGRTYTPPTTDGGTNPTMHVVTPWHHTYPTPAVGRKPEVKQLHDVFEDWLDDGMHEDLEPGLVHNPWRMASPGGREHWWRGSVAGFSAKEWYLSALRSAGYHVTTGMEEYND